MRLPAGWVALQTPPSLSSIRVTNLSMAACSGHNFTWKITGLMQRPTVEPSQIVGDIRRHWFTKASHSLRACCTAVRDLVSVASLYESLTYPPSAIRGPSAAASVGNFRPRGDRLFIHRRGCFRSCRGLGSLMVDISVARRASCATHRRSRRSSRW